MSGAIPLAVTPPLGFAGAPLVDWDYLRKNGKFGDLVFFGYDGEINRRYGRNNNGAANFILANTVYSDLAIPGTYDLGIIETTDPADAVSEIANTASKIIESFDGVPVLVACDHTASLGALLGNIRGVSEPPVYIYFDAHFDLGRNCEPDDLLHNGGFVGEILRRKWASCAINVGGRSYTTNLNFSTIPKFVSIPASRSQATVIERLAPLAGQRVYVSIDADVIDPTQAPNVSCPEPNGMKAEDLLAYCHWLGENCKVVGADLTEILPAEDSQNCEQILMSCLLALKKKSVF